MQIKVKKATSIYVIHQLEVKSHYLGLMQFCEDENINFHYNEFSWRYQMLSGIKHLNKNKRITRSLTNFVFLLKMLFFKNRIIVLGIAPFDYRMIIFSWLAKRNHVFYHTSWPYWDGSNFPEKTLYSILKKPIRNAWQNFLERRVKGIFCVSGFAKNQLEFNYSISSPMQVVYHSLDKNLFHSEIDKKFVKPLKYLFVGRIVESKGIYEILEAYKKFKSNGIILGIVGYGNLAEEINDMSKKDSQIKYYGKLTREELGLIYKEYDILLNPSIKGFGGWEELFGLSIIESMACGCIPLATNHVGPLEIITNDINGILIENDFVSNELKDSIQHLESLELSKLYDLRKAARERAQDFYSDAIAKRWATVLKPYIN